MLSGVKKHWRDRVLAGGLREPLVLLHATWTQLSKLHRMAIKCTTNLLLGILGYCERKNVLPNVLSADKALLGNAYSSTEKSSLLQNQPNMLERLSLCHTTMHRLPIT